VLTIVTGNPGAGKSLHTVSTVESMRIKDKREVFQDGIEDLLFDWKRLPVEIRKEKRRGVEVDVIIPLWDKIPDGSIVVIDECWRVFPIRTQGSVVPDFVQFLATHRHRGLDIVLATQQVKTQVDTFVRGLVGQHIHLDRKAGLPYSMRYEWERCSDPTSTKDLGTARSSRWMFPKEFYGQYKSATEHTHKRNLPTKQLLTLGICAVLVVVLFIFAIHSLSPKRKAGSIAADSSGRVAGKVAAPTFSGNDFWVRDRVARVAGVPASAPVFDALQHVSSQPRPEGCMSMVRGYSVECECTGPNHSVLQISLSQCLALVKKGWFDETKKYADVKAANIEQLNKSSKGDTDSPDVKAP
jgi:zona occludens toxin